MQSLNKYRQSLREKLSLPQGKTKIIVGMGTCGIAAGAEKVFAKFKELIYDRQLPVELSYSSCLGICYQEVNIEVQLGDGSSVFYGNVTPDHVHDIIQQHIIHGKPLQELVLGQKNGDSYNTSLEDIDKIPFYNKQTKQILKRCGYINPDNIDEYIISDGYKALDEILANHSPEEVIEEVVVSGLRGRGGGGFSTGIKWGFARKSPGKVKYIICNADEGDPGAFMDRAILEGDPHAVIEGMTIAGFAIGASEGYIYVRAEYPLAIKQLKKAIESAESMGLLGENILGSNFNFKIRIKAGAGAFVCGEETALIASIEGERGVPRVRPPYPAVKGLWDKPSNINNVETYANIPLIFINGGQKYAAVGTKKSKGTKVFAVTGKVERTGLVEVPMGISLREIIFDTCGGIPDGKEFKAVQIGGPSGGCLPKEYLDLPIDYDSLIQAGAMMGSGGLVVMDETTCMVDLAKFFLSFTQRESCGKCTPCREGTKRMLELLEKIISGQGEERDIENLENLASAIKNSALCGLGQTAPNPVLATLRYFKEEYLEHIISKRCPAGVCSTLLSYQIILERCKGCGICAKNCPVTAIEGKLKQPFIIQAEKCIKCGTCYEKCPFNTIEKG